MNVSKETIRTMVEEDIITIKMSRKQAHTLMCLAGKLRSDEAFNRLACSAYYSEKDCINTQENIGSDLLIPLHTNLASILKPLF